LTVAGSATDQPLRRALRWYRLAFIAAVEAIDPQTTRRRPPTTTAGV
jgi:hypothetical protein